MYYLGIDVGSTATKCIVVDSSGTIVGKGLARGGAGTKAPAAAQGQALSSAGVSDSSIETICATGYGRHLFDQANMEKSELSCHAKGASKLFPSVCTVIDIGGQDAKVLRLSDEGTLENFAMNDKCAAGTGRFLDVMAGVFGCDVSELSDYDRQSDHAVSISSTCTVFAESEVISKLASGESIYNVAAGVHDSVVNRTAGLVNRLGVKPAVAMTGGVALNEALRERLERKIGYPIQTSPLAQFNGAFGAALYAAGV
jgi:predicted CoA-substrate-specific enzyme activase